ncbi:transglutaminase domain protein [Catenulispora acidiphila DSM 44928]|uniref:Transglutaminase domain protein n=1 Tax=Catenulispora acidiphila (strain DSM 44928 / JCM 14897 / NBRC 102108 / NRRL B-24433 / ID139908) TaxID=479433 RepID=C7QBJ3_CATAD|nr:transglutaminaseTgpA domain-containing protein [Catenulispora acidiphila]ACU70570.1 transglutaminase domain protein [Catenulispora acidiphila DSM 44928]
MTGRLRIGIAAAVALLLTSSGLLRLLAPGSWVWPIVLAVIVATASGELFRRLVRPRPLVVLAQAAVVFWYDMVLLAHDVAFAGVLPTWAVFDKLGNLYSTGAHDIRDTFVGGQATSGIAAILVLSLSALAVLVDALAATYAAAPLAGLPLLALYLVPATRSGGGYDWLAFALAAGGYTALLSAEGRDRLGRWGRPLVHAGRQRTGADGKPVAAPKARVDTGPIAATGHQITMYALIVAVLAPVLLPTVAGGLFGIGPDSGSGTGNGHHKGNGSFSQVLDLKANLGSLTDDPVLDYNSAKPEYIRLQTLDVFDPKSTTPWTPDPSLQLKGLAADGTVSSTVPGLVAPTQPQTVPMQITYLTEESTKVSPTSNLSSLPVPYPAKQVTGLAAGFEVDPDSLAVLGVSPVFNTMTYRATVYDTTSIPPAELAAATGPTSDDKTFFNLSRDLDTTDIPPYIKQLAEQITAGLTNPVDKAQAIQNYFQNSANHFRYTLDVPKNPTGLSAMQWLLQNKAGYCQFYAETMAAMARSIGIPARIAVGFTPGQSVGGDTWAVKMHDYHSWPELFMHGVGWLRFEPTVGIDNIATTSGGHGRIPSYSTNTTTSTTTAPSQNPTTSSAPGAGASSAANCPVNIRKAGGCSANLEDGGTASAPKSKFSWLGWFGSVPRFLQYWLFGGSGYAIAVRFILLALLLIACVPMVVRIVRRRARWKLAAGRRAGKRAKSGGGDEDGLDWESADVPAARRPEEDPERLRILAAWDEVRDSATDLGYTWPTSETPRRSAERIIKQAHLSRPAQDAMGRVTVLAERANYARTLRRPAPSGAAPTPNLLDDVKEIRAGLAEPVSRRTRIRATVLPPSAMAALRERREDFTGRVYERVQGTGSRLRARTPGAVGRSRPEGRDGREGREGREDQRPRQ